MQLARPLKRNPREVAGALVEALMRDPRAQRWVEAVDIAGPGFINPEAEGRRQAGGGGREILAAGARYGHQAPTGRKVLVEFVSANPTGAAAHRPHPAQAALGDRDLQPAQPRPATT